MRQPPHRRQSITVEEDAGALRRSVAALAANLPGLRTGDAELVATELATNIVRHAPNGGYALYRRAWDGIELLAVDHGPGAPTPGTPDWAARRESMPAYRRDGLGVGLSGVRRLASTFDCYSGPGGTVVFARLGPPPRVAPGLRWGGVNVPVTGVGESGDAWAVSAANLPGLRTGVLGPNVAALVVDGLGHGPAAAMAADAAVSLFDRQPVTDLELFVRQAHEEMRRTRGGVLGVCLIEEDRLTYAGVGNVTGRVLLGGESRSLLGRGGTLGTHLNPPPTRVETCFWGPGAALVLVSDGIRSRWDPSAYPGLLRHDPAVVAATLQRDHGRGSDDATVLVVHDVRDMGIRDMRNGGVGSEGGGR